MHCPASALSDQPCSSAGAGAAPGKPGDAPGETACSSILSAREPTEVGKKDELFADSLASAEEMVVDEKGEQMPMEQHVHTFSEIDESDT